MKIFNKLVSSSMSIAFFIMFTLLLFEAHGDVTNINIGGIFEEDKYENQMAFKYAVKRFNMLNSKINLTPLIQTVSGADSFQTGKAVCKLTSSGVAAILGTTSGETRGIVQSVCENMEIPHLEAVWLPDSPSESQSIYSINFYPDPQKMSSAFAALVQDNDWKGFTILYEEDDGLIRLQELLKRRGPTSKPVVVRQLEAGGDNLPLFKAVKKSGETHVIIDCKPENVLEYFRQASLVQLTDDYTVFMLTSLDAHMIDFSELTSMRSNVSCLRMIDPESSDVLNVINDWQEGERIESDRIFVKPESVKLETALINDAVKHFAKSLVDLNQTDLETTEISCDDAKTWPYGMSVANFVKMKESIGLSGEIKFEDGKRIEYILEILELVKGRFTKIGEIDTMKGVLHTRGEGDAEVIRAEKIQSKLFRVVSKLGAPYLSLRIPKEGEVLVGNDRFEGFALDLIDGIAKLLNFTYEFYLVADEKYGAFDKATQKWNGLIKDLLDRKADLGICDLTITYERKSVVDFTMPFMNLGISILFSKPKKEPPKLFSFLSPLSLEVWIFMATAYLGVSLLLFVLARVGPGNWESPTPGDRNPKELVNVWELRNTFWFSMGSLMGAGCDILPKMAPKEWANPHPCDNEPEELENALTLLNSMWLSMGSFLQQGSDILPKAVSTRMVAGMWWFFTLIMISSYTANLAAFLTNERMDENIESAEDLAKQTRIKYGAVGSGSTIDFFKNSNFSTYKRMWAAMESHRPSVFVKSNDEGVQRVLKGKRQYAFLMESTQIEYEVERDCELNQIGGPLDQKGYGIAMPMDSIHRTAISEAVIKLQEKGKVLLLKKKWWKEMHGAGECDTGTDAVADSAMELGLNNVGGVFVVLGCGCAIAFIISILEFLWNVRDVAVEEKISMKEALRSELKFALNVWETTKPVHKSPSEPGSSHKSRSSSRCSREPSVAHSTTGNMLQAASSFLRLDKKY